MMKAVAALVLFFGLFLSFSARADQCSAYPNAIYELYWGYNSALNGQMMCAAYDMDSGTCAGLGGDYKNDSGSGHQVCFLYPKDETTTPVEEPPSIIPEIPETPAPPARPVTPAAPAKPASKKGVVTFVITNNAKRTISLALYSSTRKGWVWPEPHRHWDIEVNKTRNFRISCEVGEKICYGGWYINRPEERWWGVGMDKEHGCSNCCLWCGTEEQNWTNPFTLWQKNP